MIFHILLSLPLFLLILAAYCILGFYLAFNHRSHGKALTWTILAILLAVVLVCFTTDIILGIGILYAFCVAMGFIAKGFDDLQTRHN